MLLVSSICFVLSDIIGYRVIAFVLLVTGNGLRKRMYWFIHLDVTNEPHTQEFHVLQIIPRKMIRIDLRLGFREIPNINKYFRHILVTLQENNEVDLLSRYPSLHKNHIAGDFKFVVLKKYLTLENEFPLFQRLILNAYFFLKDYSLSEEKAFGLDASNVKVEQVPVLIAPPKSIPLKRVF